MPAKTLDQLIGYKNLTGMIQSPVGGVPNPWPEQFLTITRQIEGDTADLTVVSTTRKNARAVNYGSASRKADQVVVGNRTSKMVHYFENIRHKTSTLTALRNFENPDAQRRGEQYVDMQTMEFKRRFDNSRISALNSALRYGAIYFDGDGNMLPSSSGATMTVDLQVPAANKNQLNGAISASWATASTDILKSLSNIRKSAVQTTGRPIKYAYYGSDIPGYLTGNTNIKELLKSDSALSSALRQNKIPTGFGLDGLEWRPLDTSHFVDKDGTVQEWFPSDYVVFLPEVTNDWYEMQEGSFIVPTDLTIHTDAVEALDATETVYGKFSYCAIEKDPVSIVQYAGDTCLPVFRDPASIFIADTAGF